MKPVQQLRCVHLIGVSCQRLSYDVAFWEATGELNPVREFHDYDHWHACVVLAPALNNNVGGSKAHLFINDLACLPSCFLLRPCCLRPFHSAQIMPITTTAAETR